MNFLVKRKQKEKDSYAFRTCLLAATSVLALLAISATQSVEAADHAKLAELRAENRVLAAQLERLENELKDIKQVVTQNANMVATKAEEPAKSSPELPLGIEFGGAIELEATSTETFAGADSSDLALAKVEAYIDTQPHQYISTHVQFVREDGSENINLDEATVTLGNTEEHPFYAMTGRWAVPFGGFDTAMNTDPLSKSLGEAKEDALLLGFTKDGFTLEGYGYNGDTQEAGEDDNIDQFGLAVSFGGEMDNTEISFGLGYISNIADSDNLTDNVTGATALNDYVNGWEVHGAVAHGAFAIYGGYMAVAEAFGPGELAFNGQGAKPVAWNAETAYTTEISGRGVTMAVTVQGTEEALALSLPETRYGSAVTVEVLSNAAVTAEYLHNEDYGTGDGGTGNDSSTATLKLAVEF